MKFAIIGSGRVGLPFGLHIFDKGHEVIFCDKDQHILNSIRHGVMPFYEPGFNDVLKQYSEKNTTLAVDRVSLLPKDIDVYVITVGTPVEQHIETNLDHVFNVILELIDTGNINNKTIMLRSTVAPGTTRAVSYLLRKHGYIAGLDVRLVMCPERLAEGCAREELNSLTQLCGGDADSFEFLSGLDIFKHCVSMSWEEAELGKIFSNIYRYINFSIANYMMYVAAEHKVDIHKLLDQIKYGYPRNKNLPTPGFAAGTCLRKDFGMIVENTYGSDLLMSAYRANEYTPKFIVELLKNETCITLDTIVGVYGYTFKSNSDDARDSLTPKLIRYLEKEMPKEIIISDPYYNTTPANVMIKRSNIVIIAMPHTDNILMEITDEDLRGKIVVDLWNIFGRGLIFKG